MSEQFNLYTLPISGGGFPVQLALLSKIYDAIKLNKINFTGNDYTPQFLLAASGGNIAAYLGLAGDWSYEGICRVSENINSEMFVKSWLPKDLSFIPTWALSVFTGTIYRSGDSAIELLKMAFPGQKIKDVEILTLAFNSSEYIPQIFSNKSKEESLVPELTNIDKLLFNMTEIKYLNGNIEEISKVCMASAAIPILTQSQNIDGCKFDDGGLSSASPLSVLPTEMYNIIQESGKKMHLFYYSSYDLDDNDESKFTQYGGGAQKALSCMIHSRALQDRAVAIQLLEKIISRESIGENFVNTTTEVLASKMAEFEDQDYVLFLYPKGNPHIKITKFDKDDIINLINEVRKEFNFTIWH